MESSAQRPLVLGHRGARQEAPENTLPAFQRALESGAAGVELDARLTADGQVIVLHDDDLARTTDGQGRADELTWEEIHRLNAQGRFGPAFAGTRVPTLAEALEALAPVKLVNVELKGPDEDTGLERRVLEVVRAAGMLERVVFSSFSPGHLRRLRQLDSRAALAVLYGASLFHPAPWALAEELRLEALHPWRLAVSAGLVKKAHARGLRVRVWTVNAAAEVRRLAGWGVDGIISDVPGKAVEWVQ
jgi:glycerophosphoryl diester phosphodiesterase